MSAELTQAAATREHLRTARHHLDEARGHLDQADVREAAPHVERAFREALSAVTSWNRVRLPADADVPTLGHFAMQFSSVLRTFVRRALAVLPVLQGVGGKERLGVHDREGVETGWFTARNLYLTVASDLQANVGEADGGAGGHLALSEG